MSNRILIDPAAFAAKGQTLEGSVLLADLDERARPHDLTDAAVAVRYRLRGGVDRRQRPYLDLDVDALLPLRCQRCLKPVEFCLNEQVRIVLFADEQALDEAMAADEELEGMLLERETDVSALLEDQILMALPFAPKHEQCPDTDVPANGSGRPNPFAVLAGLKKSA